MSEEWFAGRTAVVTGAAEGIGAGIAARLAALGAHVVAVDRKDVAPASGVDGWRGDLARDDTAALAAEIEARHGPVSLIVNNVGIDTPGTFLDTPAEAVDAAFAVNLLGPWQFTRRLVQSLIDRGEGGAIVFISSLHDHVVRTRPHYSASKAAVSMLVREMAQELGPHGIRVNAVSPGIIESASVPAPTPEQEPRVRRLVRLGRVGRPDDVARMVAVLLSDEWAGYVTGANVAVDGGLDLHSWSLDDE